MKKSNFSKISATSLQKITWTAVILLFLVFAFFCFEIYVPLNPNSNETITYTVQKGWGENQIAQDLVKSGIIRNTFFFEFYSIISFQHSKLQAGDYSLSPKMSTYEIVRKIAQGDVIKNTVVILEGWDMQDIATYLAQKNICTQEEFNSATKEDYSSQFSFLQNRPKGATLEGYLFPDTYQVSKNPTCQEVILDMLHNFDKKLTPDLRNQIANQGKSVFDIITMASLLEKEVRTLHDKEIVSGILWKRIAIGMPLQLDSTVNYVTGKSDPSVSAIDTKINSLYNTYKYPGLPEGPISNPGMDSIMAAINPIKTDYLYYLSDGVTIYSKTLDEQNAAKAQYLQ